LPDVRRHVLQDVEAVHRPVLALGRPVTAIDLETPGKAKIIIGQFVDPVKGDDELRGNDG
jgi:hypothetical protein